MATVSGPILRVAVPSPLDKTFDYLPPVGSDPATLQFLAPLLLPLVPKLKIKGLGEEDRFFLYFALQGMRRGHLLMFAPTIPAEVQANLPFVEFCSTPQEAIEAARRIFPTKADVAVFPSGGISYPQLG